MPIGDDTHVQLEVGFDASAAAAALNVFTRNVERQMAALKQQFGKLGGATVPGVSAAPAAITPDVPEPTNVNRWTKSLDALGNAAQSAGRSLSLHVTGPLLALGAAAVASAIDIDEHVSVLKTFLGSTEAAEARFKQLQQLSKDTPGLTTALAAEIDTQGRIAKVNTESIDRLAGAVGRLNAVQKIADPKRFSQNLTQLVTGNFNQRDLRELSNANPLAAQSLAKSLGLDTLADSGAVREAARKAGITTVQGIYNAMADAVEGDPRLQNVQENLATRLTKMRERVEAALRPVGTQIFDTLAAVFERIVPYLERASKAFADLSPFMRQLVVVFGLVAAAAGPVLVVLGGLLSAASSIIAAFGTGGIIATIGSALAPLAAPLAAIAAAAAAIYLAYQANFAGIKDVVDDAFASFTKAKAIVEKFWADNKVIFAEAFSNIRTGLNNFINFVRPAWEALSSALGGAIKVAWELIKGYFQQLWTAVSGVVKAVSQIINGDWRGAMNTLNQTAARSLELMQELWKRVFDAVIAALAGIIRRTLEFGGNLVSAWNSLMGQIWQAVKDGFAAIFKLIDDALGGIPGRILSKANEWYNAGLGLAHSLLQGVEAILINALPRKVVEAINKAKDAVARLGNALDPTLSPEQQAQLAEQRRKLDAATADADAAKAGAAAAERRLAESDRILAERKAELARLQGSKDESIRGLGEGGKKKGKGAGGGKEISIADQEALASFENARESLKTKQDARRIELKRQRDQGIFEESEYQRQLANLERAAGDQRQRQLDAQQVALGNLRSLDKQRQIREIEKLEKEAQAIQRATADKVAEAEQGARKATYQEQLENLQAAQKAEETAINLNLEKKKVQNELEVLSDLDFAKAKFAAEMAEFERQKKILDERLNEPGLTERQKKILTGEREGIIAAQAARRDQQPIDESNARRGDARREADRQRDLAGDQVNRTTGTAEMREIQLETLRTQLEVTSEYNVSARLKLKNRIAELEKLAADEHLQQRYAEIDAETLRRQQALDKRLEDVEKAYGKESDAYKKLLQDKADADVLAQDKKDAAAATAAQEKQDADAELSPFGKLASVLDENQNAINSISQALAVLGGGTDATAKKIAGLAGVASKAFKSLAKDSTDGTKVTTQGYLQVASAALSAAAEIIGSYRLTRAAMAFDFALKGYGEAAAAFASWPNYVAVIQHGLASAAYFAAAAKAGYQAATGSGNPNATAAAGQQNQQAQAQAATEKPFYSTDPKIVELLERPVRVVLDVRSDGTQIIRTINANVESNGSLSNLIRGVADPIAAY